MQFFLSEDRPDHVTVHIGQPEMATLVFEGEPFVIDAQQMQDRGL